MVIGLGLDQLDNVHGKDAEFENIKKEKKRKKRIWCHAGWARNILLGYRQALLFFQI